MNEIHNLNNVSLIFGSCWRMVVESVTCKELLTLSFCELLANSELIDPVLTPSQHSDKKLVEALGGGRDEYGRSLSWSHICPASASIQHLSGTPQVLHSFHSCAQGIQTECR